MLSQPGSNSIFSTTLPFLQGKHRINLRRCKLLRASPQLCLSGHYCSEITTTTVTASLYYVTEIRANEPGNSSSRGQRIEQRAEKEEG